VLFKIAESEPTINPYTTEQRTEFILSCLLAEERTKITIIPLADSNHPDYSKKQPPGIWEADLFKHIECYKNVILFGSAKDIKTTEYIKSICAFNIKTKLINPIEVGGKIQSATDIRRLIREGKIEEIQPLIPAGVYNLILRTI